MAAKCKEMYQCANKDREEDVIDVNNYRVQKSALQMFYDEGNTLTFKETRRVLVRNVCFSSLIGCGQK